MAYTTPAGPKGLYPDATFIPGEIVPDALLLQITTPTVPIEGDEPVVRVPFVAEDATVGFVAEGDIIPESDAALSELQISTHKIAVLSRMSREAAFHTGAEDLISTSMARAVTVKGNNALLAHPAGPTGLLATPGLIDAGVMASTHLDVLSDAITEVEANGGAVSHLLMDPRSWGQLRKLKTSTDSAQLLLGSPAEQTDRRLFGVPVIVSPQVPEGSILVVDRENIVSSTGPIRLDKSTDAFFDRDSVALRVTWRFGWGVIRPERLAKVTVTLPVA